MIHRLLDNEVMLLIHQRTDTKEHRDEYQHHQRANAAEAQPAAHLQVWRLLVEYDSTIVVQLMSHDTTNNHPISELIQVCHAMLLHDWECNIQLYLS
ncbi:unnamed protein product [Malus baccata var. baccata]